MRTLLLLCVCFLSAPAFGQSSNVACGMADAASKFNSTQETGSRANGNYFVECRYVLKSDESVVGENINFSVTCPTAKPNVQNTGYRIEPFTARELRLEPVWVTESYTSDSGSGSEKYTARMFFDRDFSETSQIRVSVTCR